MKKSKSILLIFVAFFVAILLLAATKSLAADDFSLYLEGENLISVEGKKYVEVGSKLSLVALNPATNEQIEKPAGFSISDDRWHSINDAESMEDDTFNGKVDFSVNVDGTQITFNSTGHFYFYFEEGLEAFERTDYYDEIHIVSKEKFAQLASSSGIILTSDGLKYKYEENGEITIIDATSREVTKLVIPEQINGHKVTKIRDCACGGLDKLVEIALPNTLKEIGIDVFSNNPLLKTLTIPDSVTVIGGHLASACKSLETVKLPANLTTIEYRVFAGDTALKEINIPKTITKIGTAAFNECSSLKSLIIPETVTTIEDSAFGKCDNLTLYVYKDSVAHAWAVANEIKYELITMSNTTLRNTESEIALVGSVESTAKLNVEDISKDSTTYKEMIEKLPTNYYVLKSYDISVVDGKYEGKLTLTFTLESAYEGRKVIVLHKKANGEIEKFEEIVKNNKITITTTELSPFLIATSNEKGQLKDDSPKTGVVDIAIYIASVALISGVGIILLRRKSK